MAASLRGQVTGDITYTKGSTGGYTGANLFGDGIFEDEQGEYVFIQEFGVYKIDKKKCGDQDIHQVAWDLFKAIETEKGRGGRGSMISYSTISEDKKGAANRLINKGYVVNVSDEEVQAKFETKTRDESRCRLVFAKSRKYEQILAYADKHPDERGRIRIEDIHGTKWVGRLGNDITYQVEIPSCRLGGSIRSDLVAYAKLSVGMQVIPGTEPQERLTRASEQLLKLKQELLNLFG